MIRPDSLSDDWPKVHLGDVVEFLDHKRKPITAKDRIAGPYPYYGANGQQDSVEGYIFDEPLILLAEDGGNFGGPSRTIAYQVEGKCWVNNHAHVLRPTEKIDIRYLCRHLEMYDVRSHINGATREKLNKSAALEILISLPPLKEQIRIAAILDKADAIRRKRQQAIDLADQLLRSVFLDMFGDPVMNPKGLKTAKISEVGEVITGSSPSRAKQEYYGDYIEWIKSGNINTPDHYLTKADEFLSKEGLLVGRSVPENSLLVTCIAGSKDCIGNIAIANRPVSFNQQINAIVQNEKILTLFLYAQLAFNKVLVQRASTESMKGMVNKSKFSKIEILLPSIPSQERFVEFFHKSLKEIEMMKSSRDYSINLLNSLTQQAFNGELIKQAKAA